MQMSTWREIFKTDECIKLNIDKLNYKETKECIERQPLECSIPPNPNALDTADIFFTEKLIKKKNANSYRVYCEIWWIEKMRKKLFSE